MSESPETAPVLLDEDLHRGILASQLIPGWTKNAVAQDRPVVVAVAGPPGSGKSALATVVKAALDRRGGAVLVGSDHYKELHPRYRELLAADEHTAGLRVRPTVRRWQAELEEECRRSRYDAVVETALADPAEFRASAWAYRASGHRIEVAVIAVPDAWSQLGVVDRYLHQAETTGAGRYVSWDNHDDCAQGLLETLAVIEDEQLVDRISVLSRTGEALYANELSGGMWRGAAGAVAAVTAERALPWSAAQTHAFHRRLAATGQRMGRDQVPEPRRLSAATAAERAVALAEPHRRTAQVRLGIPGVDYHRLSPGEHRWTFENLIVPGHLESLTAQDQPLAVYVMGPPGAGKTGIARLVLHALAARGPVHLADEKFAAAHPDYHDLLATHPRTVEALIRADVRLWKQQTEAFVRSRRGDAVIETAPRDTAEFLDSAQPFHRAGYRVHLIALAVRAADSRQGTAQRYADAAQHWGTPGRFTSRADHDRSYDTVAATVHDAQTHPALSTVLVLDRDARPLWPTDHHQDPHPLEAVRALAAERLRPYTRAEATRFTAVQQRLRSALPQYRSDLDEIDALARPLLPTPPPVAAIAPAAATVLLPLPARPCTGSGYGAVSSR